MPEKNIADLYNILSKDYKMIPLPEFSSMIQDSAKARGVYDILQGKGYKMIEFDDFRNNLRIEPLKPTGLIEPTKPVIPLTDEVLTTITTEVEKGLMPHITTGLLPKPITVEPLTTKVGIEPPITKIKLPEDFYLPPVPPGEGKLIPTKYGLMREPDELRIKPGEPPKPKTLTQKIMEVVFKPFKETPKEADARIRNIFSISKSYGLPISYVRKNYNDLSREIAKGVFGAELNAREKLDVAITPVVAAAIVANPISAALGIGTFMAVSEAENLIVSKVSKEPYKFLAGKEVVDLLPEDANRLTRGTLEVIEILAKMLIAGKVYKTAVPIVNKFADKFTRDIITTYKIPEKVYIRPDKVADIFRTGKEISPEELDIIKSIPDIQWREAIKKGISIEIPSETIVKIVDKPWYGKVKGLFGIKPYEEIKIVKGEPVIKYQKGIAGLLEEKALERIKEPEKEVIPERITEVEKPLERITEIPVEKKVVEKPVTTRISKIFTEYPKYKKDIDIIKSEIEKGEAPQKIISGGRMVDDIERVVTWKPSTYPEYFKDKGYTKKESLNIIDKVKSGKPITEIQTTIIKDLIKSKREIDARRILKERATRERKAAVEVINEVELEKGDKFKIEGEEYVVKEKTEKGAILENDMTIELDDFKNVAIDKGSLEKAEVLKEKPKVEELKTGVIVEFRRDIFTRGAKKGDKARVKSINEVGNIRLVSLDNMKDFGFFRPSDVKLVVEEIKRPPTKAELEVPEEKRPYPTTALFVTKDVRTGEKILANESVWFYPELGGMVKEATHRKLFQEFQKTGKLFYEGEIEKAKIPEKKEIKGQEKIFEGEKPHQQIARYIDTRLGGTKPITWQDLFDKSDAAYKGTQAEGKYSVKDAYDAMEMGANQYIMRSGYSSIQGTDIDMNSDIAIVRVFKMKEIMNKLPTQTKRTKETIELQQFSTPPPLAFAVGWVANINKNDIVLEPSAGTGNLAIFAKKTGADVYVNEIDERRLRILEDIGFKEVTKESAEYLNAVLPKHIKPNVVIMNPPFSAAERLPGAKLPMAAKHIEQALARLEDDGRLVSIVGRGMSFDAPTYTDWWNKIMGEYNVRANILISGEEYRKFGTTFDNRILVIDKTGKTEGNKIVSARVEKIEELIPLLEEIRDARVSERKQVFRKPEGEEVITEGVEGITEPKVPIRAPADVVGGRRGEIGGIGTVEGIPPEPVSKKAERGVEVPEAEITGERKAGLRREVDRGERERPGEGGVEVAGQPRREVESRIRESDIIQKKEDAEIETEDIVIFNKYKPTMTIEGSVPHPTPLVESLAMSTVKLPKVDYKPTLDKKVIEKGLLSESQIEGIIYAGAAHSKELASGRRQGFFCGDGTGTGKGRIISGIIQDNWNKGRKKAIWLSKNWSLLEDAKRDLEGIGWKNPPLKALRDIDISGKVKGDGILFTTYDTMKIEKDAVMPEGIITEKKKFSRMEQIIDWFGEDFDGVLLFDESHNMGNSISVKNENGNTSKPSQNALKGIALQDRLKNARVAYFSATGATNVRNLGYATRLGLWGENTQFTDVRSFVNEIEAGGLAAMEIVARDLKATGLYAARNLSSEGVIYDKLKHILTEKQSDLYSRMANMWLKIMQGSEENFNKLNTPSRERGFIRGQLYNSIQRFFACSLSSMATPSVIKSIENDLKMGNSAILQIVYTNEAGTERGIQRMESDGTTIDEIDTTPRDILRRYVEEFYPTQLYETYYDETGRKQVRPVLDSGGNIVEDPDAIGKKEEMVSFINSLPIPDGTLEILLSHFGGKKIAEVTGKKRRVYTDPETNEKIIETRNKNHVKKEIKEFLSGKRRILVFSNAGGTGASYHAGLEFENKSKRIHYLLQAGWQADQAIQGLGRSHRSNQAVAPEYKLVTTDVPAQMRFIATIAKRLDQMGALTRGQREAASQGLFTGNVNVESKYGEDAVKRLFRDIKEGNVDITVDEIEKNLGITFVDKRYDAIIEKAIPSVKRFLNRLLMTPLDVMQRLYDEFYSRFDRNVQIAIDNETFDVGLETIKVEDYKIMNEDIVYTDESGATSKYVEFETKEKNLVWNYDEIRAVSDGIAKNEVSGKMWGFTKVRSVTDPITGNVITIRTLRNTLGRRQRIANKNFEEKFEIIDKSKEKEVWETELKNTPKISTHTVHMITGTLLPLWNRISTKDVKVKRLRAKNKSVLGRVIRKSELGETLKALGAGEFRKPEVKAENIPNMVLEQDYKIVLENKWSIKKSIVSGDERIELTGPDYYDEKVLVEWGVFREDIGYRSRYFIPTGEKAKSIIANIVQKYSVSDVVFTKKRGAEGRDLAFNPKNLEQPKKESFGIENDKIIRRSEIAKFISEKLNVPIRRGKFRKRALGIYKVKPKVIRIKAGDIRTISHEVGHYLDDIIPDIFSRKIKKFEINFLLKDYVGAKPLNKHKEAFSEYLRYYITEPVKARSKAPDFHKYFEKTIKKYPEVRDVILSARRDYQRWIEMPATSKVLSQISIKEEKAGIGERIADKIVDLYKTTLDDLFPIKQFVALAKKRGIEIPEEENPYILGIVKQGWVSKANTFLEKGTFNKKFWEMVGGRAKVQFKGKSLKTILRPVERKGGLEDLSIYLTSRRAIELNKRKIRTGIDTKDALLAIKELKSKYPEFPEVAQELYRFQDDVLQYGYQSGLYDSKLLFKIKLLNKNYVPFYRVFEELQSRGYMGKGFVNISKQIKRIKGSEREIINPLESIVKNTYTMINAADRNQVGVIMANLAAKDKELARLFEEIPVPMAKVAQVEMKDLGIDLMGMTENDMGEVMDIFRPSMFLPKDNVLTVLIKGKKKFFQVDPNLYKALMSMEREEMGIVVKMLSAPTRWLRIGAILAPEFMVRNPIRDIMTAFVYSKYGFIPIYDNVKGIFSLVKKDNDYWLWRMGGGEHSMLVSMDRMYLKKSFDEIVKKNKFTNYIKHPIELLRIGAEISEKINRLPEAKLALSKGKSPIEAAYASREITLDFGRKAKTADVLNKIIAFWKPWALGWEKLIVEHKNFAAKTVALGIIGITIPTIINYLINRDDPRYKEIAQWQKDLFWIIFTKDPPENWNKMSIEEKKEHLSFLNQLKYGIYRIPRPFELGILYGAIPERILEYIDTKDPEVIKKLGQNILDTQSPGLIPTALEPLIENWSNYDFFLDRPVVPRGKEALPPESQYTGYTSEVAKKLGELFKYPPAKIDNIFQGYFAGLGRYATDGIDKILKGTGISPNIPEPSPQLADRPVIRAFVVRRPVGSASESVDRFYEKLKDYEAKERMLKEYIRLGEKEKFYKYKNKYPEILFTLDWEKIPVTGKPISVEDYYSIPAREFRKVARTISELRKKENLVYSSKTMSSVEKRLRITEIDKLITDYAKQALEFDLKSQIKLVKKE